MSPSGPAACGSQRPQGFLNTVLPRGVLGTHTRPWDLPRIPRVPRLWVLAAPSLVFSAVLRFFLCRLPPSFNSRPKCSASLSGTAKPHQPAAVAHTHVLEGRPVLRPGDGPSQAAPGLSPHPALPSPETGERGRGVGRKGRILPETLCGLCPSCLHYSGAGSGTETTEEKAPTVIPHCAGGSGPDEAADKEPERVHRV